MDKQRRKTSFITIPLARIKKAPWNYKHEDGELQQKLVAQIKRNGQLENVVVRETGKNQYQYVNGNHRHGAFIEVGMKECVAYNLGHISEAQAKRIAIEMNETRFKNNRTILSQHLQHLVQEFSLDDLNQTLPYDEDELAMFTDEPPHNSKVVATDVKTGERIQIECAPKTKIRWSRFVDNFRKGDTSQHATTEQALVHLLDIMEDQQAHGNEDI